MPASVLAVPCLRDNYAYLLHDAQSGQTAVIDLPESAPVLDALAQHGWALSDIWITHHHPDHVDGVAAVVAATGAKVWGARADAHRLPPLDHAVTEGDQIPFGAGFARVIDVSGHTNGHIAFHLADDALAFTADSLMVLGCGRLFEGTADQMWDSLCKLAALPDETLICSGHDYTQGNAAFALSVDPDNPDLHARITQIEADRASGKPMAMVPLRLEKTTNPFLRATDAGMKRRHGYDGQSDLALFAHLRRLKDHF